MQTKLFYAVLLFLAAATTVSATALHAGKSGKDCCRKYQYKQQPEKEQDTDRKKSGKDSGADYPFIPLFIH